MTRDRLARLYGNDRFVYRTVGPDFFDTLTKTLIELTTPGELRKHLNKGGDYSTCDYGLYRMTPKNNKKK